MINNSRFIHESVEVKVTMVVVKSRNLNGIDNGRGSEWRRYVYSGCVRLQSFHSFLTCVEDRQTQMSGS